MKTHIRTILVTVLMALLVVSSITAESYKPTENVKYKQVAEPFVGTSVRVQGMGGAGLGVKGYHDSFLFNPANLAGSGFKLSLPAVTVTVYNPKRILEDGIIDKFEDGSDGAMASGALALLNTITKNHGDVLTTDVSTTFTLGGLGLSVQAQERLMTYKTTGMTGTSLIAQLSAAATLGYGMNINAVPGVLNIDLGVSAQAVYKAYLRGVSGRTILNQLDEDDFDFEKYFLNETPLIAGWALPFSFGMNLNFPYGLSLSAVARNINGNYNMTTYASVDDWAEEVFGSTLSDNPGHATPKEEEWSMESDWSLDFGFTWAPKFLGNLIQPTIAVDVVDVMKMAGMQGDDLNRAFFEQTRLGASVRLLSLLDVRYGINMGYQSLGVGFDLLVFHIDAAYYTREYGASIGDKPIDALSLRFSLISR